MGSSARCAGRVSSPRKRRRTRELSPNDFRRSCEHFPREGDSVPGGREHLLLCVGELRKRRLGHYHSGGTTRWYASMLSTLRTSRLVACGSGPDRRHRTSRCEVPDVANVRRSEGSLNVQRNCLRAESRLIICASERNK